MQSQEDPCDNPFTEAFTFIGGSYVVFPGIIEDATYILRQLGRAIFMHKEPFPDERFVNGANSAFGAILMMSNSIAARAGLPRGILPDSDPDGKIYVPNSGELQQLKTAVAFDAEELGRQLYESGILPETLDPFIVEPGEISAAEYKVHARPLDPRPLVRADDLVIMLEPGMLPAALRHRLICLALENGVTGGLAERYRSAVWDNVVQSLEYLGHLPVPVTRPALSKDLPFRDGVFTMDSDKALYVLLTSDDLSGYTRDQVFGRWTFDSLAEKMEERQRAVEDAVFMGTSPPNEMCVLLLQQGLGRYHVLGFGEPPPPFGCPRVIMRASDLETIAWLEGGDPLLLWKYAKASERLRDHTKVVVFSQLLKIICQSRFF